VVSRGKRLLKQLFRVSLPEERSLRTKHTAAWQVLRTIFRHMAKIAARFIIALALTTASPLLFTVSPA
jgi:hypothetical protein